MNNISLTRAKLGSLAQSYNKQQSNNQWFKRNPIRGFEKQLFSPSAKI